MKLFCAFNHHADFAILSDEERRAVHRQVFGNLSGVFFRWEMDLMLATDGTSTLKWSFVGIQY